MVQFTIHQALQPPPTASGTSASLEPGSWRGRRRKGRCEGGEAVSEPHARLCDMDAWHRCSPPVALWSAQLAQVAPYDRTVSTPQSSRTTRARGTPLHL